jgi:tetratricopeptide (TPR) repeat protein
VVAAPPSTVEVRKQIWLGALGLVRERPVFGQHAGQFAFEYPRVRRDEEIELSSFHRQFRTTVDSAHNDWLELVIEHGVAGLLLLLGLGALLARAALRAGARAAAPLAAFAVLMFVRSPLGNAPAGAWVACLCGALLAAAGGGVPSGALRPWLRAGLATLGLALLGWGVRGSLAELFLAGHVENRHDHQALARALELRPCDPRLIALGLDHVARKHGSPAALVQGLAPVTRLLDLPLLAADPNQPAHWWRYAEAFHEAGDPGRALEALAHVHELDPHDPQAAMLRAAIAVERGDTPAAIQALYDRPGPRLRGELAATLGAFAEAARARDRATTAARLEAESAFVRALDLARAARDDAQRLAALVAVDEFRAKLAAAALADDARGHLLIAAVQLARGSEEVARRAGELVADRKLAIPRESRPLLEEPVVQALLSLPEWRGILNDH